MPLAAVELIVPPDKLAVPLLRTIEYPYPTEVVADVAVLDTVPPVILRRSKVAAPFATIAILCACVPLPILEMAAEVTVPPDTVISPVPTATIPPPRFADTVPPLTVTAPVELFLIVLAFALAAVLDTVPFCTLTAPVETFRIVPAVAVSLAEVTTALA